ncbi:DUF1295 domain-containing protein [Maribellus maritimus]|uniref:DUF1295 domain-containing protein n=1 Tax=Maribellus maritimus TaxID=2870838 RepID=UPI001EECD753|nr:DUF1295 domain-containing protein [Maribellus maritimus]MCG6189198.1 DUF1295 domain-containing protein [Maribellus maritimus]
MLFFEIYIEGLIWIVALFTLAWIFSVRLKDAGIVDIFWGLGFVLVNFIYFQKTNEFTSRSLLLLALVGVWGLRLSIHIFIRNLGKPEDYRYQNFRKHYGPKRYWWVSFFQVFLLQGVLVWLISSPLLAVQYFSKENSLNVFDFAAVFTWLVGFTFEAGADYQLRNFKANPENKGKVLQTGFWKFTRHPNYFGDASVWWSYAIFSVAAGSYFPILSSVLMTWLIIRVSGVTMLEKSLKQKKSGYEKYALKTSAFFPWFQKTAHV